MNQPLQDAQSPEKSQSNDILERGPELVMALFLMFIAALVLKDSIRVGTGWADDGPQSGYFPFYIGCILLASSASIFFKALLSWNKSGAVFAERSQLATVFAMLIPMSLYIISMIWLGLYLPSVVLIAYFMIRYGKFNLLITTAISLGVPIAFFLLFERWFLVPLPKGPIEILLGL